MVLKHLFLTDNSKGVKYSKRSTPRKMFSLNDKIGHANNIQKEYRDAINAAIVIKQKEQASLNGYYVDIYSQENVDLENLENKSKKISLIGLSKNEKKISKATVFIPDGKVDYYDNKINKYKETIHEKSICNRSFVESIEHITNSTINSFWTSDINEFPNSDKIWCEMWIRKLVEKDEWDDIILKVHDCLNNLNISYRKNYITFPERCVLLIQANQQMLLSLIYNCDCVTELRKFYEPNDFFMSLSNLDQHDFCEDLLKRVNHNKESNVSVCLLDTGINKNHLLLKDFIISASSELNTASSPNDLHGHGSEMAGIILYDDLNTLLNNNESISINHKIESVKIISGNKDNQNPKDLYGYITSQAIFDTEINNPKMTRTYCMAVTAEQPTLLNGKPSSWSSCLDRVIFNTDNEKHKRLFVVSAGNVYESEYLSQKYPEPNLNHGVEDPGQSWNAITIGAYTNKDNINSFGQINPLYKNYNALVPTGSLSPYSSTSIGWNKWPIKPEVLFAGGNMCTNGVDIDNCPNLGLLTTSKINSNFEYIYATSSATAQAANFISRIYAEYPKIWPETVRALLVHSSNWTEEMKKTFLPNNLSKSKTLLLRTCGYGIPNLQRALECKKNCVNLIVEDVIQPYMKTKKSSNAKYNEMKVIDLPWPKSLLKSLGSTNVRLKITLSYFIEPSPSNRELSSNYNYASCGLRFDIKQPTDTDDSFYGRVNYSMKNENSENSFSNNSLPWFLGKNNQSHGSIHSDFFDISAVKLPNVDKIAVYPVSGWWKTRTSLKQYNKELRYSLIVSIETPEVDIDLYNAIKTSIKTTVMV